MFIDSTTIVLSSGHGGAGSRSFRREKHVTQGGPDGGDGGSGGDVIFVVDKNSHTLSFFHGKKNLKADDGEIGKPSKMDGKNGKDLILNVPPGTMVYNKETKELLLDMLEDGKHYLLLKGGKGGWGNVHFKNSVNQAPTYAQQGLPGITMEVLLELKLIADVGLVGFPNVGKSTLISTVSNARPEIADYWFTTITPKLGVVNLDEYNSFVLADIPGIIEGASNGKGLGIQFLRHIERTKINLYMIDATSHIDPIEQLAKLKNELKIYSSELFDKPFAIAITKIDAVDDVLVEEIKEAIFDENAKFILPISAVSGKNIDKLKFSLFEIVKQLRGDNDKV